MPHVSRKLFVVVATTICLFHFGCGSSDDVEGGWFVDDDSGFPHDVTVTAPTDPDAGGSDAGPSFDLGNHADSNLNSGSDTRGGVSTPESSTFPDIGRCSRKPSVSSYTLSGPPIPMFSAFAPRVANGSVYFHQTVEGLSQVFVQQAGSGVSRQLTDEPFHIWLEEAAGDTFVTQSIPYGNTWQTLLQVRNTTGFPLADIADPAAYGLQDSGLFGAPSRSFNGDTLITFGADDHYFDREGALLGEVEFGAGHVPQSQRIVTRSGAVYAASYVTRGPPGPAEMSSSDVFRWTPETGPVQITDTPTDENFVWSDGLDLYWQTSEGIYKKQAESEPKLLHRGLCGPPHAVDGLVAFACAAAGETLEIDEGEQLAVATELYLSDGVQTRRISLDGGTEVLHSVRVGEKGLAWFEFDTAEQLCQGGETGRVMYLDFATGQQVQLGKVIAPCLCCESGHRPLSLDVENGVIAWSNAGALKDARFDSRSGQYIGGFAYATVMPPPDCNARIR